jgi:hypothetical protein
MAALPGRGERWRPTIEPSHVSCDERGAFLGLIPLLRQLRDGAGRDVWTSRSDAELNRALSAGYGLPVDIASKSGGLAAIVAALNRGDLAVAQIAAIHLRLPELPLLTKHIGSAKSMETLAARLHRSGILKLDWDPTQHPRAGSAPNPGWFTSVNHQRTSDGASNASGVVPIPVVDFSGGFHHAVVKTWMDYFQKNGIPAVQATPIRVIGPDERVIGYPDMIVRLPGRPVEAIEVKTGSDPPLTPNQRWYIPMLQFGGHIYSNGSKNWRLGA